MHGCLPLAGSCHTNGKNLVNPSKTLSQADLTKNGMFSQEAVQTQVRQVWC
jgi:hypothetical protein